ncbi:MAG: cytochrome c5 family protein [Reinekea sp.]
MTCFTKVSYGFLNEWLVMIVDIHVNEQVPKVSPAGVSRYNRPTFNSPNLEADDSMKKLLVFIVTLAVGFVIADTNSYEDQVAERLKPAGNVCIQGQECETATAAASSEPSGPLSGEEVYSSACIACHGSGVLGAPKFGSSEDWAPRIAQGIDVLHDHALNGFNSMPARGGNASLSDEEVFAAIDHMISSAQ